MDGILRVHKHIVEGGDGEGHNTNVSSSLPTIISARLLVAATQAGSLIGRQGSTIKSIQDNSGAVVRVLPADDFPYCALSDDRIVEIQSETPKVQKALELVVSHLRKFLVDRTVLQLYELNRTMTNAQNLVPGMWGNNAAMNFPINPQLGISSAYTASGPPYENYFTNFDPPNNQDLNMYGRDPASGGATMSLPPPAAPTATIIAQYDIGAKQSGSFLHELFRLLRFQIRPCLPQLMSFQVLEQPSSRKLVDTPWTTYSLKQCGLNKVNGELAEHKEK
eukprot:Gb_09114 [translate_table: standard]